MADTESKLDEFEYKQLEKAIADVEALVSRSAGEKPPLFEAFLQNARTRLGNLDKKIKETNAERENRARAEAEVTYMVAREIS